MKVLSASLPDILIIEPQIFSDERGFFMEIHHQRRYTDVGIDFIFVQDNLSLSTRGTLRGLHYQLQHPQAKLIQVIMGTIHDVAVDIRRGSPTFGHWTSIQLSGENKRQVFIPEGFAHGFCVLSDSALVIYKCTDFYAPHDEGGILWSDPALAIDWPTSEPLLSKKDRQFTCLADVPVERLPLFGESKESGPRGAGFAYTPEG
jgi:dTDP-4-dehydrorhamnose 3,5-epimerase